MRLAHWDEIDLAAALWIVPAERMKAQRQHRVPLSRRAVELLRDAMPLSGHGGLVFPSARRKPLSDMTLSKLLKDHDIVAVPHGFRSSFRDWASERTIKALENDPREIRAAAVDAQRISDWLLARERERSRGDERAAPPPAETAGETRAPSAPERSPRVGPDAPANVPAHDAERGLGRPGPAMAPAPDGGPLRDTGPSR